jgi:hypothetical protein
LDPTTRTAILIGGVVFCAIFALLTITVALDSGFSVLTVFSLLIIGLIAAGVIGAIRNPPDE